MSENETTAWGFQQRIMSAHPGMNKRYAQRVAYRLKRRMDFDTRWVGANPDDVYEEGLRILGILTDPTARDAVRNLEAAA